MNMMFLLKMLRDYNLSEKEELTRDWYNGYIFGGEVIYNPWSVLNYIDNNKAGFMPYWINSSSNDLIKKLLLKGDNNMKLELEDLIAGNSMNKIIDDVESSITKFSERFYEGNRNFLLNYISSKFLNPEEQDETKKVCIFGLKPNEFEILK